MVSTLMSLSHSGTSKTQAVLHAAPWRDLACRRRQYLATFGVLAPLTGLAGPLFIVPAAGELGWVLVGVGLLACVALMFYLAKLDADLSQHPAPQPIKVWSPAPVPLRQAARSNRFGA